jgi:hypothetical protein
LNSIEFCRRQAIGDEGFAATALLLVDLVELRCFDRYKIVYSPRTLATRSDLSIAFKSADEPTDSVVFARVRKQGGAGQIGAARDSDDWA